MKKSDYYKYCDLVYDTLTKAEKDIIARSSCGPDNNKFLAWLVPDFFKTPCRKHDIDYLIGGEDTMRLWADQKFYNNCKKGFWLFRPFAKTYYNAVRKDGWKSWSYRNRPSTLEEIRREIKLMKNSQ